MGNFVLHLCPKEATGFSIHRLRGSQPEKNESEIKVADRGCGRVLFFLTVDGRVSGRVLEYGGKPLANSDVTIFSADKENRYSSFSNIARTDGQEQHEIGLIPPGQYKLSVNKMGLEASN